MDSQDKNVKETEKKEPSAGSAASASSGKTSKGRKAPVVVVTLIISIILIGGIVLALFLTSSARRRKAAEIQTTTQPTTETTTKPKTPRFNFVFWGIDPVGYTPGDIFKSDISMVISISPDDRRIDLVSILRDTKVNIDGLPPQKLNAAYQVGGADFAMHTLNQNFRTDFTKYLTLEWANATRLIDYIGGVDLEITEAEAENINYSTARRDIAQDGRNAYSVPVYGGYVHLDGTQATHFCRIRKIDDDLNRTFRQHRMIRAIQEKVKAMPPEEFPGLIMALMENEYETNITIDEVSYLMSLGLPYYDIYSTSIPDFAIETDTVGVIDEETGWFVWIYNIEEGINRLHSIVYN